MTNLLNGLVIAYDDDGNQTYPPLAAGISTPAYTIRVKSGRTDITIDHFKSTPDDMDVIIAILIAQRNVISDEFGNVGRIRWEIVHEEDQT